MFAMFDCTSWPLLDSDCSTDKAQNISDTEVSVHDHVLVKVKTTSLYFTLVDR